MGMQCGVEIRNKKLRVSFFSAVVVVVVVVVVLCGFDESQIRIVIKCY